ncbi:MAG: PIN domain-containing protein [Tepidisphaeraceae bacterium]
MSVLVDSTIWSLALRRKTAAAPEVDLLRRLVRRDEARIIGAVRQEVLSGIRSQADFIIIRDRLRAFPDITLAEKHHERAAEFYNTCRTHGVQGSSTDFLICAVADMEQMQVFTTDDDFERYARHLPIDLL